MSRLSKLFTWEAIIMAHIALLVVFLLAGCSTHHSLTVGDNTYVGSVSIGKIQHD